MHYIFIINKNYLAVYETKVANLLRGSVINKYDTFHRTASALQYAISLVLDTKIFILYSQNTR